MKYTHLYNFSFMLAFAVILSTVAPVTVLAVDTVMITNSVITSSDTGGKTGANGKNGTDGTPGLDGQAGTNGRSVINGVSTATMWTKSVVNGEAIVDVHKTIVGKDKASAVLETQVSSVQSDVQNLGKAATPTNNFVDEEINRFERVLYSIHLMLSKYVSFLF